MTWLYWLLALPALYFVVGALTVLTVALTYRWVGWKGVLILLVKWPLLFTRDSIL